MTTAWCKRRILLGVGGLLAMACSEDTDVDAGATGDPDAGSDAGGDGSGDGDAATTCVTEGSCDPATCASGACFDENRCASDQVSYWGAEWHEYGQDVAIGPSGERILVGQTNLTGATDGDRDLFIAKLNPDGSEVWSSQWGTPGTREYAFAVVVDASGNSYFTGASEGALDGQPNQGSRDVAVVKVAPDGARQWTLLFGTAGGDTGQGLALDSSGNLLVAGQWGYDYDAEVSQPFVATVSLDGVLLDVTPVELGAYSQASTIKLDPDGNIVIAGDIVHTFPTGNLYAQKRSPDGQVLWTLEWGSEENDWPGAVAIDGQGTIFVAGTTAGALEGNPDPGTGNWSAFVSQISSEGELGWTHVYNNDVDTRGADIALAANGDLLLLGSVLGELTLGSDSLGADIFFMRLCPDGTRKTVQQWGLGDDDWATGIAETPEGHVVLVGYARRDPDLGGGSHYNDAFVITVSPE